MYMPNGTALKGTFASDEELPSVSVLTERASSEVDRITSECIVAFLDGIQKSIEQNLRSCVASALGFRYDQFHNTWEATGAKESIISGFITEGIIDIARQAAQKYITTEVIAEIVSEKKDAMVKLYREQFHYKIREAVCQVASEHARHAGEAIARTVIRGVKLPAKMDLADPKTGADPITAALLPHIVEQLMTGKSSSLTTDNLAGAGLGDDSPSP